MLMKKPGKMNMSAPNTKYMRAFIAPKVLTIPLSPVRFTLSARVIRVKSPASRENPAIILTIS